MAIRKPNYIIVIILLVISAAAVYGIQLMPVRVGFTADFTKFPVRIGHWTGVDANLGADVVKALGADTYISREYTDPQKWGYMNLLVVYRKYGRRDFVHRPEMCYPAAGWEIKSSNYTTVPFDGKNIEAMMVTAEKDGTTEVILYWFASGERTEASFMRQQYQMAFDRLRDQKYGWAFIRLNAAVESSVDETLKDMRAFLAQASGPLVASLTEAKSK